MKVVFTIVALLATTWLPEVISQQNFYYNRDTFDGGNRLTRQTSADQMVQNILQWLQGVYSQNSRKIRQGTIREYLPPSHTQKPRPFEPPTEEDNSIFNGYPPAGSITPQPPFPIVTSPVTGGTTGGGYPSPQTEIFPPDHGTGYPPSGETPQPPFPPGPDYSTTSPPVTGYTSSPEEPGTYSPGPYHTSEPSIPSTGPPEQTTIYLPPTPYPMKETTYAPSSFPTGRPFTTLGVSTFPPIIKEPTEAPSETPVTSQPEPYPPATSPRETLPPVTYPPAITEVQPPVTYPPIITSSETQPTSPPEEHVTSPPEKFTTYGPPLTSPEITLSTSPPYEPQSPGPEPITEEHVPVSTSEPQISTEEPSQPGYTERATTIEPITDDDLHPPHIHAIDVECAKDMMTINIEFNREFNGVIYSKGFYSQPECRYVQENSGQTKYSFTVSLNSCGTEFINAFDTQGQSYLENVLVLQNEPGIQEVWDTIRSVRCLWEGNINKALSVSLSVGMLTQEIVTFSGDTAMARLDIQLGKGPFATSANGLVKIGEPMTLVVSVTGDPGFDIQVKECKAKDTSGDNEVALTDENGCVLKPKLFGAFQKTKETGNTGASIIAYAFFNAFKFPDIMDLMIECNIELCKTDCEVCPDSNQKYEPGRRRRRDVNNYNDTLGEPIKVGKVLRVLLPEDLSEGEAIINIKDNENICMSVQGFVFSSALMISLLTATSLFSAHMWLKNQRFKVKS